MKTFCQICGERIDDEAVYVAGEAYCFYHNELARDMDKAGYGFDEIVRIGRLSWDNGVDGASTE